MPSHPFYPHCNAARWMLFPYCFGLKAKNQRNHKVISSLMRKFQENYPEYLEKLEKLRSQAWLVTPKCPD